MKRSIALALGLLAGGCGDDGITAQSGSTSSDGSSSSLGTSAEPPTASTSSTTAVDPSATSTSTDGATTSAVSSGEASDETGNFGTGCGFTCPPVPPVGNSCSLSDQDCGEDSKCAPWANDGGWVLNAVRCVPLAPDPAGLDEPCTVEGSEASGVDTCDIGLKCHGTQSSPDDRPGEGTCIAICSAYGTGVCPPGDLCIVPGPPGIGLCTDPCDPLADECPEGEGCHPAGLAFGCWPSWVADPKANACETSAHCAPGSICLDADRVTDCDSEACCATYCDLDAPDCGEHSCVSLDAPLAAHASVGYCDGS